MSIIKRNDWFPLGDMNTESNEKIKLNISGMLFEVSVKVLSRDVNSILYQLSLPTSQFTHDDDGYFYFQQDWWIFRYILMFLRDGYLPDNREILCELYKEATYWHLKELQVAIVNEKLHLKSNREQMTYLNDCNTKWWQQLPKWIGQTPKQLESKEKKKEEDWWKSTSYKGKSYDLSGVDIHK